MKLLHDLRGPIATSSGIQRELVDSMKELTDEISSLNADLPKAQSRKILELIETDIEPCLEHLGASLSTLNGRVKSFAGSLSRD